MPSNDQAIRELEARIATLERERARDQQDISDLKRTLRPYYVQGRMRTDRTVPATSTEVVGGDQIYDLIFDGDAGAGYVVANVGGTLKWGEFTINFAF